MKKDIFSEIKNALIKKNLACYEDEDEDLEKTVSFKAILMPLWFVIGSVASIDFLSLLEARAPELSPLFKSDVIRRILDYKFVKVMPFGYLLIAFFFAFLASVTLYPDILLLIMWLIFYLVLEGI